MITIFYNGTDAFSGISPTPLIERQEQMVSFGERWNIFETFTLNGVLTGTCGDFNALIFAQQTLLNRFSQDFQTLEIYQNGELLHSKPNAIIKNISFGESKYVGLLPYSLVVECYPSEFFSGYFGVTNPSNQVQYTENKDGTVSISHTVSAKGFNTTSGQSNALRNAQGYVNSLTGLSTTVLPQFISLCSGVIPCLRTISESINRLEATYSITESYVSDPTQSGAGVLRYTTDYNSGIEDGISTVSVKGDLQGCRVDSITGLRARYQTFDVLGAAINAYNVSTNLIDLNPEYLSSGVEENPFAKKLSFDVLFNNDKTASVYFDYKTTVNTDSLKELSSINFDGTIRGRGDLKTRYQRVLQFYSGVNVWGYIYDAYTGYGLTNPLNPNPTSSGTTFNSFAGEININVTLDDRPIPPSGLNKFDFTIAITPAIEQYSSKPLLVPEKDILLLNNEGYVIFDLGYANRYIISINGAAQVSANTTLVQGINVIKTNLNGLSASYGAGLRKTLDSQSFTTGNAAASKAVSFNSSWSCEAAKFTIP